MDRWCGFDESRVDVKTRFELAAEQKRWRLDVYVSTAAYMETKSGSSSLAETCFERLCGTGAGQMGEKSTGYVKAEK